MDFKDRKNETRTVGDASDRREPSQFGVPPAPTESKFIRLHTDPTSCTTPTIAHVGAAMALVQAPINVVNAMDLFNDGVCHAPYRT
jgi:hypothetical protein